MKRTSESKMALAVAKALRRTRAKRATLAEIRAMIPRVCRLTADDKAESPSRPSEPLWWQTLRNSRSHGTARKYGLTATPDGFAVVAKPPAKPATARRFVARPVHGEARP